MSNSEAQRLTALKTRMHACRACIEGGYEVYPHAVAQGHVQARMMIVGQAPGITEQKLGRPFNAGSGKRLFRWLKEAGINEIWFRATQYMTSVTKCYPGRARSGSGDRRPTRVEQKLCRPYLDEEFTLIVPEVIIPIGRLAIELYFPKKMKLTELIGTQKQVDGQWIVPLPHPSGASRWPQIPANKALIAQAVELIGVHYRQMFG